MGNHDYLLNIASVLYIVCYVPELWANYKNKNANVWNMPEKVVMLIATSFAFSYSVLSEDSALILNYGPILGLDILAFGMRGYYAWKTYAGSGTPPYQEQKDVVSSDQQNIVVVRSQEGAA